MFIVVFIALLSFGTTQAADTADVTAMLEEVRALKEQGVFTDAIAQAKKYIADLRWSRRDRTPETLAWYNESVSPSDWEIQLCKGDLAIAGLAGGYWTFEALFYDHTITILQNAYRQHTAANATWDPNYRAYRDRTILPQLVLAALIYTLGSEGVSITGKKYVLDKWLTSEPTDPRPFTHSFGAQLRSTLLHIMSPQSMLDGLNAMLDQFGMTPAWCKSWPYKISKAFTTNLLFIIWMEAHEFTPTWHKLLACRQTGGTQVEQAPVNRVNTTDLTTPAPHVPFSTWLKFKTPITLTISTAISAVCMLPSYYKLYTQTHQ